MSEDKENQNPFQAAFDVLFDPQPEISSSFTSSESCLDSIQGGLSSGSRSVSSFRDSGSLPFTGESESIRSLSSSGSFFPRPPPPKSRTFVFTCSGAILSEHGVTSDYFAGLFDAGGLTYICCGYEYSKEGYSHIQGFARFQSARSFKGAVKFFSCGLPNIHVEPAKCPSAALAYCKKGGSFEEKGNSPFFSHTTGKSGRDGPRDLSTISKAVEIKRQLYSSLCNGATPLSLIHERPEEYGFILSVSRFASADRIRAVPAKVLYVWGTTGLGKTTTFQTVCDRLSVKYFSKCPGDRWFDGYNQQAVILFDEFSDVSFTCNQWNGLCDPNPSALEVKGTKFTNTSSHYVVLSNCCPEDLYPRIKIENRPIWDAFRRRLTDVHHFELTSFNTLDSIRNDLALLYSLFLSDLS